MAIARWQTSSRVLCLLRALLKLKVGPPRTLPSTTWGKSSTCPFSEYVRPFPAPSTSTISSSLKLAIFFGPGTIFSKVYSSLDAKFCWNTVSACSAENKRFFNLAQIPSFSWVHDLLISSSPPLALIYQILSPGRSGLSGEVRCIYLARLGILRPQIRSTAPFGSRPTTSLFLQLCALC